MNQFSAKELADRLGIDYAEASALCKVGVITGQIKEIGKRPQPSGKGKPSTIYATDRLALQIDLSMPFHNNPAYMG